MGPPAPPPKKPTTKKEKKKAELMASLGMAFDSVASTMPEPEDKEFEMLEKQAMQMIQQMVHRSKLPPTQELTLREWCDLVWRTGNASPLDQDEPQKEEEDDDTVEL